MKYNSVIFDLDGTILSTLDDLADSVNHALEANKLPTRTINEVRCFVGNGMRKLIERAVPDRSDTTIVDQVQKEFATHYKIHSADKTKPYDGIAEMLDTICENGIKAAVVTNKMHTAAKDIVEFYFGEKISITVGQLDGIAQKPQPDGVLKAIETLGVSKEKAVYVGDSEVDCITAKNAQIDCIGVTWGFRSREILKENGANVIVDSPAEILNIL